MRKLLILWAFWFGLASPALAENTIGPTNQVICNKIATLAVGTTGLTKLISGIAGTSIYVCGWHTTNTGASGTFLFANGTGSNCATGTNTILPATNVTNTAPSADHISIATIQVTAGNDFCINPSVNTISTIVYFSQF